MTVSFRSNSFQYKKLLSAERRQSSALRGHGYIAIFYHPHHARGAWFQGKEKVNTALEVHPFASFCPAVRICPVDSILCHQCPSPACSSETRLQDVLKRGTGEESTAWNQEVEASPSPAESNLSRKEPTWAEGSKAESGRAVKSSDASAGNSCVESSPASKAAAW